MQPPPHLTVACVVAREGRYLMVEERDKRSATATIDADIHRVHWLDYAALCARSARMRSPLVLASIERHRQGICYPLELIYDT